MAGDRASIGRTGEDAACGYLEGLGFEVVTRNFRTRSGEIDVIARRGALTVFVEVKARRSTAFGEPEESVTPAKARRIRALAADYLSRQSGATDVRFDVVSVLIGGDGSVRELRHIPDAF